MAIKLMNSWLQVEKEAPTVSKSSLIIIESKADKVGVMTGKVVNLPEKLTFEKIKKTDDGFEPLSTNRVVDPISMGLTIGCRVLFRSYLATMHELSDGTFLVHWQDILAVVEDGAEISNL